MRGPRSTSRRSGDDRVAVAPLSTTPPAGPSCDDDDDDDPCPICYVPFASMASGEGPGVAGAVATTDAMAKGATATAETAEAPSAARVVCKVCKHAVCAECDQMLTKAAHEKCPMCRAPRPRRSTLPVQILIHAFHCRDSSCERPQCAETKLILLRMEVHAQHCPKRGLTGADECKVCKLWKALHRTREPEPRPHPAAMAVDAADAAGGDGGVNLDAPPAPIVEVPVPLPHPAGGGQPDTGAAVRARLRELPPAQVKRMLLSHVRGCHNRRCETCRKLRERIRTRAEAAGVQNVFIA